MNDDNRQLKVVDFTFRLTPEGLQMEGFMHGDTAVHTFSREEAGALLTFLQSHASEIRGIMSFEESQRRRLCPYCGDPGQRHHDLVLDLDQDLDAYRCSNQHTYFVEKRFVEPAKESKEQP